MKLRPYTKADADLICSWIQSEEELYRWSADIFCKYPLFGADMDANYSAQKEGRFFPMVAEDEEGNVVGHFIIRYPKEDDDSRVRFGFVILDPDLRGKGNGRQMLLLGIEYVKANHLAKRIELGVFANNPKARRCYESVGFKEYNVRPCSMPIGEWECADLALEVF